MEATEFIVFDFNADPRRHPLRAAKRAVSRRLRARVTSLAWSAGSWREGLSATVAVKLRVAVIRLQSVFTRRAPVSTEHRLLVPGKVAAGLLAVIVLVFVPTSAINQISFSAADASAGHIHDAPATGAAETIGVVSAVNAADIVDAAGMVDAVGAIGAYNGTFTQFEAISPFVSLQTLDATSVTQETSIAADSGSAQANPAGCGIILHDDSTDFTYLSLLPSAGALSTNSLPTDLQSTEELPVQMEELQTQLADSSVPLSLFAPSQEPVTAPVRTEPDAVNLSRAEVTASDAAYCWPADGELTSRFGYRKTDVGSTNHKGIDIGGFYGDPIYAAAGGEVIVSGWNNSFGYVIHIQHGNGDVTIYSHCSALLVSVGERVEQRQEIARMGKTGVASGVHLHFELIVDGLNIDPLSCLP